MDLFSENQERVAAVRSKSSAPLSARMRPKTVDDIAGQDHIIGPDRLLRRAIEADRLGSIILYGPPGCGKTSLAEVIAKSTARRFERVSGVMANVAILRNILKAAEQYKKMQGKETILFIDEIHRFNKSQQDVLLPNVENGDVTLIGATTHNPSFFINTPLCSRSQIFQLEPVSEAAILTLLERAIIHPDGLGDLQIKADPAALIHLAAVCEGDARRALNALEIAALTTPPGADGVIALTKRVIEDSVQRRAISYDHDEDEHYDTISAFIKSIRGSDPDAAVYWLAKMLFAGEDPRFIARRLIISASEDIGNADPRGLTIATSAMQAVGFVGMPEARIILAQATTYLASAPKSNAAYLAINDATADIRGGRVQQVPKHLRDTHYKGAADLGNVGYKYAHDGDGHFVVQDYLTVEKSYYKPSDQGYEETIGRRMAHWRNLRRQNRKKS